MQNIKCVNTKFHNIDFEEWDRRNYFYYFTKMLPTSYTLTVNVDITNTYRLAKKEGLKFFPIYLYLVSKLISEQQELRIAMKDNRLGYYEVLHPSYACFHEDDKSMSNLWTEYDNDFNVFYSNYQNDVESYSEIHGIIAKPDAPENSCMTGMVPWIDFTSYTPIPHVDSSYYFPVIQAGKYTENNDRIIMPLSVMAHHAVADGYHVSLFFEKFRDDMASPKKFI